MATQPIFGIFQGGGAKGIAHVGALAAAEENFHFVGVAGSSAGALIACLVAAGFKAKDVLDPAIAGGDLLSRRNQTPVSLLGDKSWRRLKRLRKSIGRLVVGALILGAPGAFALAPRSTWSLKKLYEDKGLMSTERVREFINSVLREQVTKAYAARRITAKAPDRITFADLDYERFYDEFLPLKIIGTNITTGELWVFDKVHTPDIEVALAVTASFAIPVIFEPVRVEHGGKTHLFVDGGLVSNLPAWVFAKDKIAFERGNDPHPPVPVVGFTLRDKTRAAAAAAEPDFATFLKAVAETSLAAGQAISQDFLQDLKVIALETDLDLLDFDVDQTKMVLAYYDGYRCAQQELKLRLIDRPQRILSHLGQIHGLSEQAIRSNAGLRARQRSLVRASLIEPTRQEGFEVTFAHNMASDCDDRLSIDARAEGAPKAFLSKDVDHFDVAAARAAGKMPFTTKYDRALIRDNIRSVISIPVFQTASAWNEAPAKRPKPRAILCIDSDLPLANVSVDRQIIGSLVEQSLLLYPLVQS